MIEQFIGNMEIVILSFVSLSLLIFFGLLAIILFIALRERKNFRPVLRPQSNPAELLDSLAYVQDNFEAFSKNICYLQESPDQSPDLTSKQYIGMIVLKNYGNEVAVDIDVRKLASYSVSDGPEKKLFSLSPNETKILLFYLPPDVIHTLTVNKMFFQYQNALKSRFKDKVLLTHQTGMGCKLEDETTLMAIIQV